MIEIRRILCPIDFSDFSRRALDHARAIAAWYESTVTVMHVWAIGPTAAYAPTSPVLPPMVLSTADRDALLASMRRFAEPDGESAVPVEFAIAEGYIATEILAKAEAMRPDLLVMGTHGRSGFERMFLGSVTERVLRKASCPVLSVPRHASGAAPAPAVLFKSILCAIDFSDCSMHALNFAMSLAQEADARLTLMHVIELPPELPVLESQDTAIVAPHSLTDYVAATTEDRRARLQDAVPDAVRAYCTVETVLTTGKPYREILRVAAEEHSDLIVIGIHGRRAADLLFFGSTAQHVVRQANCPVLTMRRG